MQPLAARAAARVPFAGHVQQPGGESPCATVSRVGRPQASRFGSTLPSDGPSRFRPCALLVLHLHQRIMARNADGLMDFGPPSVPQPST
jgi:hypothetical protein